MRRFPHLTIALTLAVVCRAVGLMFVAAAQSGAASAATPNYQGLWSNAPAESESGSGIKFAHQCVTIFATWVTYDFDGSALRLSATAAKGGEGVYTGTLYRTTDPAFNAQPFDPDRVTRTPVGRLTITFAGGNTAALAYTMYGITQRKSITRTSPRVSIGLVVRPTSTTSASIDGWKDRDLVRVPLTFTTLD